MKHKKIVSISINEDTIHVYECRTETYEKCAFAYFAGPDGWGVTMNIQLEEVQRFTNDPVWQKRFIDIAKEKLGMTF
ncbi:hypothetical protein R7R25_02275 [Vibrio sp. 2026]|uniref:hypothetical protein n=1 Tax=unclassified Vibrio TaxID=2614977 RepID=UPI0029656E57|nr:MULTISPECIES: hypothetical protein [unclassified Vibrio]MDW2117433.1 hypothetical protein [Vibrio sp. 2026]MDW2205946.1 hypothetical protein [Vibrio sp. 2025]